MAASATFSVLELDDVMYDYLCIGFVAAQSPKPSERIISRALFGTTCWMHKSLSQAERTHRLKSTVWNHLLDA